MSKGQLETYVATAFHFGHRTTIAPGATTYLPATGGTNQAAEITVLVPQVGALTNLSWDCQSNGLTGVGNKFTLRIGSLHATPTSAAPALTDALVVKIDGMTNGMVPLSFPVLAGQRVGVLVQTVAGGTSISRLRVSFELEGQRASQTWQLHSDGKTVFYDGGNIRLTTGAAVNQFSTDPLLAADSDFAVPTAKAVKAYVDAGSATVPAGYSILGQTPTPPPGYSYTGLTVSPSPSSLATSKWTAKAAMSAPRSKHAVGVVNGKLYAVGGSSSLGLSNLNEEYDPLADTWTRKASMPTPRSDLAIGVVNGRLYAVGGSLSSTELSDATEQYDPSTDSWTRKASMLTPRTFHSVGVVNGRLYAVGGFSSYSNFSDAIEEYDPSTDTWTRKANLLTPRFNLAVGVVNGKLYAVGGSQLSAANEEYAPLTNTWTSKASMPTPRGNHSIGVVNGRLNAVGGIGDSGSGIVNEDYDPATNAWSASYPLPAARSDFAIGVIKDSMYAVGGLDASSAGTNTNLALAASSVFYVHVKN